MATLAIECQADNFHCFSSNGEDAPPNCTQKENIIRPKAEACSLQHQVAHQCQSTQHNAETEPVCLSKAV